MLRIVNVSKIYCKADRLIKAVDDLTLTIEQGDFAVIHGPSGCGKSTLLMVMGGMLKPDAGHVFYNGRSIYSWSAAKLNLYRQKTIGFIFQQFFLVPYLSVYDNIKLPLFLRKEKQDDSDRRIRFYAEQLGISERLFHKPAELSAGERQRAAMARTLAAGPEIIVADEPTGNLDPYNTEVLAACLHEQNRQGKTVILASHDNAMIDTGSRTVSLNKGHVR